MLGISIAMAIRRAFIPLEQACPNAFGIEKTGIVFFQMIELTRWSVGGMAATVVPLSAKVNNE